jgi:hypothetical protein
MRRGRERSGVWLWVDGFFGLTCLRLRAAQIPAFAPPWIRPLQGLGALGRRPSATGWQPVLPRAEAPQWVSRRMRLWRPLSGTRCFARGELPGVSLRFTPSATGVSSRESTLRENYEQAPQGQRR